MDDNENDADTLSHPLASLLGIEPGPLYSLRCWRAFHGISHCSFAAFIESLRYFIDSCGDCHTWGITVVLVRRFARMNEYAILPCTVRRALLAATLVAIKLQIDAPYTTGMMDAFIVIEKGGWRQIESVFLAGIGFDVGMRTMPWELHFVEHWLLRQGFPSLVNDTYPCITDSAV